MGIVYSDIEIYCDICEQYGSDTAEICRKCLSETIDKLEMLLDPEKLRVLHPDAAFALRYVKEVLLPKLKKA